MTTKKPKPKNPPDDTRRNRRTTRRLIAELAACLVWYVDLVQQGRAPEAMTPLRRQLRAIHRDATRTP